MCLNYVELFCWQDRGIFRFENWAMCVGVAGVDGFSRRESQGAVPNANHFVVRAKRKLR